MRCDMFQIEEYIEVSHRQLSDFWSVLLCTEGKHYEHCSRLGIEAQRRNV